MLALTSSRAPVNVFAWQYLGAAIFVPLYFLIELESHFSSENVSEPEVPYLQSISILPATTVTIIHLYRMVYFPPGGTTTSQHQAWLAVWQLAPFLCYCAVAAISMYLASKDKPLALRHRDADLRWIQATYATFGLLSGIMHTSVMYRLATSQNPSVSLVEAFIPRLGSLWQPDSASSAFIAESAFFLQWDYIIIVIVGGIYVAEIAQTVYGFSYSIVGWSLLTLAACVASHILGPGFVWAAALLLREDFLRLSFSTSATHEGYETGEKSVCL
jgi:hypothetical protein